MGKKIVNVDDTLVDVERAYARTASLMKKGKDKEELRKSEDLCSLRPDDRAGLVPRSAPYKNHVKSPPPLTNSVFNLLPTSELSTPTSQSIRLRFLGADLSWA